MAVHDVVNCMLQATYLHKARIFKSVCFSFLPPKWALSSFFGSVANWLPLLLAVKKKPSYITSLKGFFGRNPSLVFPKMDKDYFIFKGTMLRERQ